MLDCDPHERLEDLAEDDLTRHGLRGPDYRSHLQLFDGCANGCGRRDRFFTEVRMDLFELSYLALGPPAKIAIPGVPQIEMRNLLEAACRIELRRQLVGKALVLDWTVRARLLNGPLVQTHGVELSIFNPGDFGLDQSCRTREGLGDASHPLAKLVPVLLDACNRFVAPFRPLGCDQRGERERRIEMIIEEMDLPGRCP